MTAFNSIVVGWSALGVLMTPILFLLTAPYGRHAQRPAGPTLPSRVGWIVMETPSSVAAVVCFVAWPRRASTPLVLLGLFLLHYINRAFIYPVRMRAGHKPMPVAIVASAFFFTSVNGVLQGFQLTHGGYGAAWLRDPRFLAGAALFLLGFAINQHSDAQLRRLRKQGETGYQIPRSGLFRLVSCPNYLGEILEWCGWSLATWSLAGLSFAIWTIANLLPRARAHHRWYRATFADYPPERRALVPYLF